jgi:hypothetical protein
MYDMICVVIYKMLLVPYVRAYGTTFLLRIFFGGESGADAGKGFLKRAYDYFSVLFVYCIIIRTDDCMIRTVPLHSSTYHIYI